MKKTMLLGMAVVGMLGVAVAVTKLNTPTVFDSLGLSLSNEQLTRMYLSDSRNGFEGYDESNIVEIDYDEQNDWIGYVAYDDSRRVIAGGGFDKSWYMEQLKTV